MIEALAQFREVEQAIEAMRAAMEQE